VVYPPANHLLSVRDSTFIFGSVGNGRATLTINGAPVKVHPNGGWLGFLPVPRETARYELVVALGADTTRYTHPVRIAAVRQPLATTGGLVTDTAGLAPLAGLVYRDDETVRVGLRAPANATAWVTFDGGLQTLTSGRDVEAFGAELPARLLRRGGRLFVVRGRDTLRYDVPRVAAPSDTGWVQLGEAIAGGDSDRTIVGRPTPAGTYKWFFQPGTRVLLTGRQGAFARVRLDRDLEVWVDSGDVKPVTGERRPAPGSVRTAGNARVRTTAEWTDVNVSMSERAPFLVEERDDRILLTLYNVVANTDQVNYLTVADPIVRRVDATQETSDRVRYTIELAQAPYGYAVLWENGAMVLRLRRRPTIDPRHPLRGLTIVVDPGHPPGGATGPTGLWEPQATLGAGQQLERILRERGATVVMTRTTMGEVALGDRPVIARRANGHAFVSLHLDALPDGANPFVLQGTGTYFYRMNSEPLARHVQRGMFRQMGIRDRGVYMANFAVARQTWMPAVLAEGGFLMIPEQEAFFRSPAGQERYARGVADGLEAYFREMAR